MLRRSAFALPFGCLVAIATHFVRFGDEHAFGGSANDALVAAAVAGSVAAAAAILRAFMFSDCPLTTGTIASARARALIPGAPALFALAALVYYGIESLEGNGIELGLPTVVLLLGSMIVAGALRGACAFVARLVAEVVRDWLARLDRRQGRIRHVTPQPQPMHAQIFVTARRFGRAPPDGRRFR